jgi:hypothetical protein
MDKINLDTNLGKRSASQEIREDGNDGYKLCDDEHQRDTCHGVYFQLSERTETWDFAYT